ncbi:MAG: hypothetical protein IPM16_22995 [Chloroflexi bacterium]|nr:hypothetical protein [Chloroflexota bacterium]
MAIDYIIDYDCAPKQALTSDGIIERLKGESRAQRIIALFRQNGDDRPPSEMGFEFTRSTPEGQEETQVVIVQHLLDAAAELKPHESACAGCPANRAGKPFGCVGSIEYPVSGAAEAWLLDRMPVPDDALVWLLLKQGVEEFKYDGASIEPLRAASDVYFEDNRPARRILGEFELNANQVFEMMFSVGAINPNHAAILLLFTGAVPRELEADDFRNLRPAPADADVRFPLLIQDSDSDDSSVRQFKAFLQSLYIAWRLDVAVRVDA